MLQCIRLYTYLHQIYLAAKNLDLNKIDSAIVQSKKAHNLFVNNANLEREKRTFGDLS